jgi:hypothetical protein
MGIHNVSVKGTCRPQTKYTLLSRHQNAGQNRDIKTANRSFENVSRFNYLETTVTNLKLIQEEIKRKRSGALRYKPESRGFEIR